MKRKTIWFLCITATVILFLLLANFGINKYSDRVKGIVQEQIQKALPPGATVGSVDFHPFTSTAEIQNVRIPNPAGYQGKDAVCIQSISAGLNVSALSAQTIHFRKLHVNGCRLLLETRNVPKDFSDFTDLKWIHSGVNLLELNRTGEKDSGKEVRHTENSKNSMPKKTWHIRIDELKISKTSVVLGNTDAFADIAEQAVEQLIRKIPEKFSENKIIMLTITQLKKSVVGWMKNKIKSLGNREFGIPDYTRTSIKIAEITEIRKIESEFVNKHVEKILRDSAEEIQEKYNAFTKRLEKWIPEKTIQKLVYTETGPMGPTERYTINFKGEIYTYEYSKTAWEIGEEDYTKRAFDQKTIKKIKTQLQGFNAKNWKDHYSNPKIIDGTFWTLKISFTDGSTRMIRGANAWPKDFSARLGGIDPISIFFDEVRSYLYSQWTNKPTAESLGGSKPAIRVEFELSENGEILSRKIKPCGNPVMDSSVTAMVNSLKRLPAPPFGKRMKFYMDMKVE